LLIQIQITILRNKFLLILKTLRKYIFKMEEQYIFPTLKLISPLDIIRRKATKELSCIMDKWCENHSENYSGGKMRGDRGADIEVFVRNTINNIGTELSKNLVAVKGSSDKKELKLLVGDKEIKKDHQVDIHVYLDGKFIAVVECKAYLDSCYYVRACDDFILFKKFGYDVKKYIFTLENSIDEDTKIFTDHVTENVCSHVFCLLDGKRTSSKPIYDSNFRKPINTQKLYEFIDYMFNLCDA